MKKKTNHKIMKKRNTKRNTKRKINKKYRSFKRRKTFKRNKKIRFTRKKLYGGAAAAAADPTGIMEMIKEKIVIIMSNGPMNLLSTGTDFSKDKKFENLDTDVIQVKRQEGHWNILKLPSTSNTLDRDLYPLFRFWHKYGCVLSDNTLYKLYINLFFHSIYSKIAAGDTPFPAPEGSEGLYNEILDSYPVIRGLAIVFYKLKHLYDDLEAGDVDGGHILNFVQYILEILTNIIIYIHLGFTSTPSSFVVLNLVNRPKYRFIRGIEPLVPLLMAYINSRIYSDYIQRDYDGFNSAIATHPGVFHLNEPYTDYNLENLQTNLEGTGDPILDLNIRDTHPNTPGGAAAGR